MSDTLIAALDIGGTKLAATIANAHGPLCRLTQATEKSGPRETVALQALRLFEATCSQAQIKPETVASVGVSSCGPFIYREQMLEITPPNICGGLEHSDDLPNDWTSIPLERVLRTHFSKAHIANDCVAALVGEREFGAARTTPNCAYVTWSTGIGFGLCVDGHILHGKAGNAGHAGHMLMSEVSNALCGCGNTGDLEGMISGRNLSIRMGKPIADIFTLAEQGDANSLQVIEAAARWFGKGLYNLVATLDLQCILVGGSVWRHHSAWLQPRVQTEICSRFPALTDGVILQSAELDELVTDIGALALIMPDSWKADWVQRRPWESLPLQHIQ